MNTYVNPVGIVKKDIYIIKNDINTKVYIGQSLNSEKRFKEHCKGDYDNSLIDKAIQKYGKQHFWFEILESQIENYNEREKYWILHYDSFKNGLNCNEGGHGNIGHKHSKESRKKMSESAKKNSEIISLRTKKTHTGRVQSYEERQKKSIKLKGLKRSDEFKNKMVKIAENREPMSTDVKLKISKSKKNIISPKREKVCQLDLEGNLIKIWEHSKDAENDLNITKGKISAVCLGNRKTTGGFKWKYLKNYEMVKK